MQKTIEIENGPTLVLRALTEDEAVLITDKKLAWITAEKAGGNILDDGDAEIMNALVSPSKAEVNDLIEDYPFLTGKLLNVLQEMGGGNLTIEKAPEVEQNEDFIRKYTKRIRGFTITIPNEEGAEPERIVLGMRKFSRVAVKLLSKEFFTLGRYVQKDLVRSVKEHVLPEFKEAATKLFSQYAFLSIQLGRMLLDQATVQVNDFAGKA